MNDKSLMLDDRIYEEINNLCLFGDNLAAEGRYEEAIAEYNKAWKLTPEPKNEWEASTWILAAIADACFFINKFKSARQALEYAMICPNGLGNPFLHLRLGQVLFEIDELNLAADELTRAYMGAEEKIFEKEDPKYLSFLRTKIII